MAVAFSGEAGEEAKVRRSSRKRSVVDYSEAGPVAKREKREVVRGSKKVKTTKKAAAGRAADAPVEVEDEASLADGVEAAVVVKELRMRP